MATSQQKGQPHGCPFYVGTHKCPTAFQLSDEKTQLPRAHSVAAQFIAR